MPFVSIRMAGTATRDQKAGIVADVTALLVTRLGKPVSAVQVVIEEIAPENYGAGGQLIADREAASSAPAAAPVSAASEPELALVGEDANAEPSQ